MFTAIFRLLNSTSEAAVASNLGSWFSAGIGSLFVPVLLAVLVIGIVLIVKKSGSKGQQKYNPPVPQHVQQPQPPQKRYNNMGDFLKDKRKECGMSIDYVAEAIGVSCQDILDYESGVSEPDGDVLPALVRLYKISVEEVLHYAP